MKIQNDELVNKIQSILGDYPFELTFNVETQKFSGHSVVANNIFNTFYISVSDNGCEISYECLEYKVRNNFIKWFLSYGGKEMFLKEYQKVSQTGK